MASELRRRAASTESSEMSERSTNEVLTTEDSSLPETGSSSKASAQGAGRTDTKYDGTMAPALSLPRALLRRLARRATQNPIEVIVSIFIVVTLAYFQLVHAVTTSNFLEPLTREATGLAAGTGSGQGARSHQSTRGAVWVRQAHSKTWTPARSVPDEHADAATAGGAASRSKHFVVEPIFVADANKAPSANLRLITSRLEEMLLLTSAVRSGEGLIVDTFAVQDAESDIQGYGFGKVAPASREYWAERRALLEASDDETVLDAVVNASASAIQQGDDAFLVAIFPDSDLQDYLSSGSESGELHSVRWAAYAMWALGLRFWALVKRADSADIFVMLSAYILMHGTFVNLFLSMRRFGSNFWLGASVLTSSICAFLCAMTMAHLLGVTLDPICLSEALPFLVITVGFEKPYLLTKAVFTSSRIAPQGDTSGKAHPSLLLSALNDSQQAIEQQRLRDATSLDASSDDSAFPAETSAKFSQEESFVRALTARLKSEPSLRWSAPQPVPAKEVVVAAVDAVGVPIVRDYAIEIAVMAVGATSGVSGLREFCQLAALILTFDCAFLFAFMVATLTIMVEVHRIKLMRGMKRVVPSTPPNVDSDVPPSALDTPHVDDGIVSPGTSFPAAHAAADGQGKRSGHGRPLWRKAVKLIFGKVPFEPTRPGARENPVARLKLLLVTTFVVLHSLNLVSTLTTQSAITRHHSTDKISLYRSIQESTQILQPRPASRLVGPILERLSASQQPDVDLYATVQDPIAFVLMHADTLVSPDATIQARSTLGNAAMNASGSSAGQVDGSTSLVSRFSRGSAAAVSKSSMRGKSSTSSSPSLDVLDSFVTGWSVIVGDPVISKWLSLALVISIFLNAYLLKGIATGNAAVAEGNAARAAAFAAARMIGAHLDRESQSSTKSAVSKLAPTGAAAATQSGKDKLRLSQYRREMADSARAHSTAVPESTSLDDQRDRRRDTLMPTDLPRGKCVERRDSATPQSGVDGAIQINGLAPVHSGPVRAMDDILEVYADGAGAWQLSDEEVILLVQKGKIQGYALEKLLQDNERAVRIRRATISRASTTKTLENSLVPLSGYDYAQVIGACCENVVGFMPLPLGIAGPLMIDGQLLPIPMATTEGTLVASTSRGCKALNAAGGVTTVLTQDAMTRGPAVEFSTISQAAKAKRWIDSPDGASTIKEAFDSTSRFARLSSLRCVMAGRTLYIRFATSTGDAMGMNMVSKGVEKALDCMMQRFDMQILSLSGNYCIDKKPSAINWIEGRGKSVCCEAVIPAKTVKSVLKASVSDLVNLNIKKNLIGSAMAGSVGGFNAHAANIVAAIFLATGQDPAQVVESSMCMTLMEAIPSSNGGEDDLLVTVSMPAIEVGTVGGGTVLSPQKALLEMLGVAGSSKEVPGAHSQRLARIIAAAVMAGELSLMGALSAGHLIQAHMKHNRSVPPTPGHMTPTSGSQNGGMFSMAPVGAPGGGTGSAIGSRSGSDPPPRFQASMTPLVAPPINGGSPTKPAAPVSALSSSSRSGSSNSLHADAATRDRAKNPSGP